ncbi:MAG: HNH endonuclease [Ignavibacteria bacterium]|jgi:site-specific DNA-methyltransferase (adenine-specific)|nr:HNH endonuclease [Ignavibacteria bacterium]
MPEENFTNTLYTNDNLFVLNGLNSDLVDLIYLDPPFNTKRLFSAPIGSKAAGSSFKDMWNWQDVNEAYLDTLAENYPALTDFIASTSVVHSKAMAAYLTYMVQRIVEMHRVLKDTGSLYLHCDPTASHYLKVLLDEVFGKNNFRNEIVWCYKEREISKKYFNRKHDIIFFYVKSEKYLFNPTRLLEPYSKGTIKKFNYTDDDGRSFQIRGKGGEYTGKQGLDIKLEQTSPDLVYRDYLDKSGGILPRDWWEIPFLNRAAKERTGYPTQKPLALLQRIIKASSNEGDIVMDPFCGCATACVAAQQLGRKWIGIDVEENAVDILIERLSDDAGMFKDFVATKLIPKRTDLTLEPPSQSVKERLYKEQNGCCNGCGNEYLMKDMEIDHIIPKAKGGGDYYENYQLLCGNCNRIKGKNTMEFLRIKIQTRKNLLKEKIIFGE